MRYSLHAHYQRFLPPRHPLAPGMCVLAGIWAMEPSGYCTVDGLYARDVLVRSQSLTIHLSILSFS